MSELPPSRATDGWEYVLLTHTVRAKNIEAWCKILETETGIPVDWSYYAGRAIVKCEFNRDVVIEAAIKNLAYLRDAFKEALDEMNFPAISLQHQIANILTEDGRLSDTSFYLRPNNDED